MVYDENRLRQTKSNNKAHHTYFTVHTIITQKEDTFIAFALDIGRHTQFSFKRKGKQTSKFTE